MGIDNVISEGDHIKITASKYPFPTVCAISQSTDWLQSISRTLKWNERERQKSFVVVEEGPTKKHRKRRTSSASAASQDARKPEETIEDEEEDEATEGEDEQEEKFDIDDLSSAESSQNSPDKNSPEAAQGQFNDIAATVSREKALEAECDADKDRHRLEAAARALAGTSPLLRKHHRRSRSRSGAHSGVETPGRFGVPQPHPPRLSPRHVQFAHSEDTAAASSSSASLAVPMARDTTVRGEHGARDDIHSPRGHYAARSRIPRDRDGEGGETVRTPTASEGPRARRSRERERGSHAAQIEFDGDAHPRRAFAVWGHDESDSAASDSDY